MSRDFNDFGNETQDALNRMKRAAQRGTGCHLTAEMIRELSVGLLGEIWSAPDPRDEKERRT